MSYVIPFQKREREREREIHADKIYSLYNVESPGGYQLTGMSIPGVDILGSKAGYTPEKPWLFEDFDQIVFYRVTEAEYEKDLALFNSGRYEYQYEDVLFDMAEHNKLLRDTADEVASIRKRQRVAQAEMDKLEAKLLAQWDEEKKGKEIPLDEIEGLLKGKLRCVILTSVELRN